MKTVHFTENTFLKLFIYVFLWKTFPEQFGGSHISLSFNKHAVIIVFIPFSEENLLYAQLFHL